MTMDIFLGKQLAKYLDFVWSTSRILYPGGQIPLDATPPWIIATWHGQHFLAPFARPHGQQFSVLVAHGAFGSLYSHTFSQLGLTVLRGSSGADISKSGGYRGFRQMVRALQTGTSVAFPIDIPKIPRIAGRGVIVLARHSGRPIVPLAAVTARRISMGWRWDRPTINLPFSELAIVFGKAVFVEKERDAAYLEMKRREVEDSLNLVTLTAEKSVQPSR
jgi:hypothetical protein